MSMDQRARRSVIVCAVSATAFAGARCSANDATAPRDPTGSLLVAIQRPAGGQRTAVIVTTPAGGRIELAKTTRIPMLAPGDYDVSANSIPVGLDEYVPNVSSPVAHVTAGGTDTVMIRYLFQAHRPPGRLPCPPDPNLPCHRGP